DAASRFVRQAAKKGDGAVNARDLLEAVHRLTPRIREFGEHAPPRPGFVPPAPPPGTIHRFPPADDPALTRPKDEDELPRLPGTPAKPSEINDLAPGHSG